ncbi:MAG: carboxymuconolactone decarboxylase family protein [Thermomicrobiales bacterium]
MATPKRLENPEVVLPVQRALLQMSQAAHKTSLEPNLGHLVALRASQLNGCAFCLSMHTRDLREGGWREDKIAVLPAWREVDWFTPREKAVLGWTEALTKIGPHGITDEDYAAARAEFSEQELAELTLMVIGINGWNRVNVAFHTTPDQWESPVATPELASTTV